MFYVVRITILHVVTLWSVCFSAFYNEICLNWVFVLQDHDVANLGHVGQFYPSCFHTGIACLTNFPSPLPRADVCPQAGICLNFFLAFFRHHLIRNGTLQGAPHPIDCTCMYLQVSKVAAEGFNKFILQGTLSSPPPQPSIWRSIQHVRKCKEHYHPRILRSIQHVFKCKERHHPPHPNQASCVASNMCAKVQGTWGVFSNNAVSWGRFSLRRSTHPCEKFNL